jgi:predicted nucleic acid-binding protein
MKAFDTDILTEILTGNPDYAQRIATLPLDEQAAPIVAVEEIIRGRLHVIRQGPIAVGRRSIANGGIINAKQTRIVPRGGSVHGTLHG